MDLKKFLFSTQENILGSPGARFLLPFFQKTSDSFLSITFKLPYRHKGEISEGLFPSPGLYSFLSS